MAITDAEATIVSETMQAQLFQDSTAAGLMNGEVEPGQVVGKGRTLRIMKVETLITTPYDGVTPMVGHAPTPTYVDVPIDQAEATQVDLDDAQAAVLNIKLATPYGIAAGRAMATAFDKDVYHVWDTEATPLFAAGSPAVNTPFYIGDATKLEGAVDLLAELAIKLDDAHVPAEGRFAVAGPRFCSLLARDIRFLRSTPLGDETLLTGQVGVAEGFRVIKTTNIYDPYGVYAGHTIAGACIPVLSKAEQLRSTVLFQDILRFLSVWGRKITRPEALVKGIWTLTPPSA